MGMLIVVGSFLAAVVLAGLLSYVNVSVTRKSSTKTFGSVFVMRFVFLFPLLFLISVGLVYLLLG